MSHDDFERACSVLINENTMVDNSIVGLLCDAIRLSREHCDYVKAHIGWHPMAQDVMAVLEEALKLLDMAQCPNKR